MYIDDISNIFNTIFNSPVEMGDLKKSEIDELSINLRFLECYILLKIRIEKRNLSPDAINKVKDQIDEQIKNIKSLDGYINSSQEFKQHIDIRFEILQDNFII